MTITINNYVTDYWISYNIIDCSEIIEEKLNNNHEYILSENINESTIGPSEINRKCEERNITKYYIRKQSDRIQTSNNRESDTQNTDKYFNVLKNINTYNNKRQMYTMPKNSRIREYESKRRKVLLDSFTNH
jgi:uncharacterized membrane protein